MGVELRDYILALKKPPPPPPPPGPADKDLNNLTEYIDLQERAIASANKMASIDDEINIARERRSKTAKDDLVTSERELNGLYQIKTLLRSAIEEGSALGSVIDPLTGKVMNVEYKAEGAEEIEELKDRLRELNTEIAQAERKKNAVEVTIKADDAKLRERLRELQFSQIKIDIKLGLKTDSDLLAALQEKAQDLKLQIGIATDPEAYAKYTNELKKLELEINSLQADIDESRARTRIAGIKDAAERERQTRLHELDLWFAEQAQKYRANEAAMTQLKREYARKRTEIDLDALRESASFAGSALRVAEAIAKVSTAPITDNARIDKIKEEISALKEREGELLSMYQRDEISRKDYIAKMNEIDEQRLAKQKELGDTTVSYWDSVNTALAAGLAENAQVLTGLMNEQLSELGESFTMTADGMTVDWESAFDTIADAATIGLGVAASSFGAMVAQGKSASKALALAVIDTLDAMVPAIVAQITGVMISSPNPANTMTFGAAGLAAAAGLIALFKGLVSVARSSIGSRFKGGPVLRRGLYELAERGPEMVIESRAYSRNKDVLEKINKGIDFDTIVRTEYLPKALERERILNAYSDRASGAEIAKLREDFVKEQKETREVYVRESRRIQKHFELQTKHELHGDVAVEGSAIKIALKNSQKMDME